MIGRLLQRVRAWWSGPTVVHVHYTPDRDVLPKLIEKDWLRRQIRDAARPQLGTKPTFGQHPIALLVARSSPDERLQRAAEEFAAVVLDALENG